MPLQTAKNWLGRIFRILTRLAVVLAIGFTIGWMLNRVAESLDRSERPAGFGRGIIQGALMPMAMPNLIVGRDVVIYATRNTGRTYRLGYTIGVNGCGVIFFGVFFWRLRRLRSSERSVTP